MKWTAFLILIACLLALSSCGADGNSGQFAGYEPVVAFAPAVGEALELEISNLAAAPEAYAGELLQVTGRYYRAPVIVCDGSVRLPPVTWLLRDGEQEIGVAGFESMIQSLWPAGLTVSVEGYWQRWRGPVGCGKRAPVREIWYLNTSEVIAPNPIARVTLTPSGEQVVQITPLPTLPGDDESTATATPSDGPEPVGTPVVFASPTPELITRTPAPSPTRIATPDETVATSTPTLQAGATITATATISGTGQPATTVTPTITPEGGTPGATGEASPTPGPSPTPGATPTDTPLTVVDQGAINFQDLQGRTIQGGQAHSWSLEANNGDRLTVHVAPPPDKDIALRLLDPQGNLVVQQNENGSGEVESLADYVITGSGTFQVVVREASGESITYLMMVLNDIANDDDDGFYAFDFADVLEYGGSGSGSLAEESDQFWFFQGAGGDRVTIAATPTDSSDVLFEIYNPSGDKIVDFIDDNGPGEAEEYEFQVPANGLYGIRIGEAAYRQSNYTISITRN